MSDYLFAFLITLFAGLSTGIGSLLAFYKKATSKKFLAFALGLSAGVMLYVSFLEIFPKALESLEEIHGEWMGYFITTLSFFGGIFFMATIDKLLPENINPHELKDPDMSEEVKEKNHLLRMGLFTAVAIAIHNFPEGLATFIAAVENRALGVGIAVAIAIHNIPEGIAVSVPVYHATGSRKKAFFLSFASGLAEPIGAVIGFFLLMTVFTPSTFGILFAGVAGIMVYISLDELLPSAEKYGEHHLSIYGLITGMLIMAASLVLFI